MSRLLFGIAALASLAACEGQTFTALSPPLIIINTDALDFEEVPVGLFAERHVTLTNGGDQPLEVRVLRTNETAFTTEDLPTTIGSGKQQVLTLRFSPVAERSYSGKLVIESSASNSPNAEVALAGVGVAVTSCGACNMPPQPSCLTDYHRLVYSETGTCVDQRCQYTASEETCPEGCNAATRTCIGAEPQDAGTRDAQTPDATTAPDAGAIDATTPDSGQPTPENIFTTPGEYQYQVPSGVTSIVVRAWGGGGQGGNQAGATGGGAGYVEATVPVTPGEMLGVWVAEGGGYGETNALGNGGGASYLRRGNADLIVAAGGGGGGSDGNSGNSMSGGAGGAGGGVAGEAGADGVGSIATFCTTVTGGIGATASSGGSGGTSAGTAATRCSGQPGARDAGGRATGVNGNCDPGVGASTWHMGGGQANGGGGGGGAGYFGGGGSGFIWTYCGAGGGGGSSFADSSLTQVSIIGGHLDAAGNAASSGGAGRGGERCHGPQGQAGCVSPDGGNGRVEIDD